MPTELASADAPGRADALLGEAPVLPVGRFEQLPKWLNLVPMVLQWAWLGLRHGSFTLPSSANPGITAGGLVGEGKLEYFRTMGPLARAATADFVAVKNVHGRDLSASLGLMCGAGLDFPVIAKPDLGWCGYGVRSATCPTRAEKAKAGVRAKVEHPFKYIKVIFGYSKVRYRGLAKNENRLHLLAGFTNLLIGRKFMLA